MGVVVDRLLESCKTIFDRSPRPFGIAEVHLDEQGNPVDVTIDYLNRAMAATADCEPADLRGKNVYELWPDGDRSWLDYYYRAAWKGEAVEFETVSVAYRTFQNVAIFPIVEGFCGYEVQDITSWLTYSHPTLENVSAGMFFYEARTQLMLLTDPARDCCGLEESYLDAREFADLLFDGEAADRVFRSIVEFSASTDRVLCEEQLRNGRWLRLSMSGAGSSGRFANGFMEDITLLKEAEASSARRSEIIESLSSEYYALHIINLDCDTIVPYLLRSEAAQFFAPDIEGGAVYSDWLENYCEKYVVEADKEKVRAQLREDRLLQRAFEAHGDFSLVFKRLFNGEEQYIQLRVIRITSPQDEFILAARNINDEVKKEMDQNEALRSALTLAKHASEAKTTFLTNISHDFRTPLNSIMGFSDLALAHLDDPDYVGNSIGKIRVSSAHLLKLINEILDVSRIESGKAVLNEQPLNLAHLMADLKTVFLVQAAERGIDFTVDASTIRHVNVLGDQLRINQILVNTVGNAMKYTDRGGQVSVTLTEGPTSPHNTAMFEIVVRDTGCGMSENFIERIFMPFERDSLGSAHVAEGTGLGMTITKNLVDLLGGTISVKSEIGRGSEFTITLPLRLDNRQEPAEPMEAASGSQPVRFDGRRVLVVDDDELSREMMSGILEDRGFAVETANDGDEAVDAVEGAEEGYFDAIIMDMRMPRMPGDVATRAIRALPRRDVATLPIIAATADAFEEGHRRSREAGMTAHITKPLDTKKLFAVLTDCLGA